MAYFITDGTGHRSTITHSKEIAKLTTTGSLKADANRVNVIGINYGKFDIKDLKFKELQFLYDVQGNVIETMKGLLNHMETYETKQLEYARGVLLLCFHVQQFSERDTISAYISKAVDVLEQMESTESGDICCLLANLNLFAIIEKLHVRSQYIATRISQMKKKNKNVLSYGTVNIEDDKELADVLRDVLNIWETNLQINLKAIINGWEPKLTLDTIVICGEYCRLYKFKTIEKESWKLAHKLATILKDFTTVIYVTSRCISLRYINDTWINDAKLFVVNLLSFSQPAEIDVVALFWLSLADFYFDCKQVEKAKILLRNVKQMPNYQMFVNSKICIYTADIEFRNYNIFKTLNTQEEYCNLLLLIHYNLQKTITSQWSVSDIRFKLFAQEQLFEVMCNVVIPLQQSLLSRDVVSEHLTYGLKFMQKSGVALRTAQYLKHCCQIDLLCQRTKDCEAKLQDLERILCLGKFQTTTTTENENEQRNHPTSPASPNPYHYETLPTPPFLSHNSTCRCFTCSHSFYQHLTFACLHIRAQLYSTRDDPTKTAAELCFHDAGLIKERLEHQDKDPRNRGRLHRSIEIDRLLYLLDYGMFIGGCVLGESCVRERALDVIRNTLEVAARYRIERSHVTMRIFYDKLFEIPSVTKQKQVQQLYLRRSKSHTHMSTLGK